MSGYHLTDELINCYRSQEYDHEQSLDTESYAQQYRQKETVGPKDISEWFHENTKLGRVLIERLTKNTSEFPHILKGIEAQIDPDFPDRMQVDLPEPPELTADFGTVLKSRRSANSFGRASLDGEQLSQCLYYSAGQPIEGVTARMYPSPGGLYPSELFPVLLDVKGFKPGLYYYNNSGHYLREIKSFADKEALLNRIKECVYTNGIVPDIDDVCVLFLVAADFWRAKFKYGPRGYRYILQENGHLVQNVLLTLTAIGLTGRPLAAFYDRKINEFVGLDGVNDAVVYTVAAGQKARGQE